MGAVDMDFNYLEHFGEQVSTGYERTSLRLYDRRRDAFPARRYGRASWCVVSPILDVWQAIPARDFPNYEAGSWGPKEADDLLANDGRKWKND
jgi:glucose-6-phosphate 1-dehydrogenase